MGADEAIITTLNEGDVVKLGTAINVPVGEKLGVPKGVSLELTKDKTFVLKQNAELIVEGTVYGFKVITLCGSTKFK